ncbi:paraquat-inducible protein A [Tatumella ptyseos]|uniref:paraquat-inducible protein A n=1 Tax=Tatumella ptyseos TaxID=82987 RepID=UPI0023F15B49|nr:paraquat-inducible protein A [Tatumella ptyseos]
MNNISLSRHPAVCSCSECGLAFRLQPEDGAVVRCVRCNSLVAQPHHRLSPSLACLITAMLCYLPANLLPVMSTTLFGRRSESTILQGVADFWHSGSCAIAAIIFIASVLIPCLKFLVMIRLLLNVRQLSEQQRLRRTRLYRAIEWVGYWSMLDVVVVAVVCGLVRFNGLAEAEPRAGILFFGLVVILTLCSALCFNPRTLWRTTQ